METTLSPVMIAKVFEAMKYQNRGVDPFIGRELLVVPTAYIVGSKVFFSREAAEAWVHQTIGHCGIVRLDYSQAYRYFNPLKH